MFDRPSGGERALLVHVFFSVGRGNPNDPGEFAELARSADVEVVASETARRDAPHPALFVGTGKAEELAAIVEREHVAVALFDHELTPAQERNLELTLKCRVVDRTGLILDIFAQRARSFEGKLQVELAQLRYVLPRLAGRDRSLSRLGGGIGARGPGETQLEVDRRRVRDRIARLERDLDHLKHQRAGRRARRSRRGLPVLSIVGYTNAGKSTLLRALTRREVHVEDKMFATLDPASRRLRFPRDREVIVTDTVGFIRDLPADLVAAFRATLEELEEADLLLHVVDASEEGRERRMAAVRGVLGEIGLGEKPELLVFNKIDRLPPGEGARLAERHGAVAVSALERAGLHSLLERAEHELAETMAGRSWAGSSVTLEGRVA